MNNPTHSFPVLALLLAAIALPNNALAVPAGQNQLRLLTDISKRDGESALSYMVTWRKDGSSIHRANGLIFIDGIKTKKPTTSIEISRKLANAINSSINYDAPQERGAIAKSANNKAELLVSNKNGFDLAQITTRDYSNQVTQFSIPGKSFQSASIDVAIDFVYSAAVEYVDGFSAIAEQKTEGGYIKLTIDNKTPIEIKTDGKTTKQIEKELAQILGSGAQFSSTPIYPNFTERKSRNYKPFDGGEIQLGSFNAKTFSIDVHDAGLGVLTKFEFPDIDKPTNIAGNIFNIIGGIIVVALIGYFLYTRKMSKGTQV